MTHNYQPTGIRNSKTRFHCRCGHNVYSVLPDTQEPMTARVDCAVCGTPYEFSTTSLPKKIGYPRSRRTWNDTPPTGIWA